MEEYDVVIIGAGPAGLTAGLYTARYGLKTIILEKGLIGGTASWAGSIQNYPGFENISGLELTQKMKEQAINAGAKIELETVQEIKETGKTKEIIFAEKNLKAKVVILALGSKSKRLNVTGEKEFLNKGIHFCATCDGPLYKEKEVAVIGHDNRAAEEAIHMSGIAKKVYLLSQKKELTADKAKQNKLKEKKVEVIFGVTVKAFKGKQMLEEIIYKNQKGNEITLKAQAAFIFVGTEPNTEFFKGKKSKEGKIIVNEKMETSEKGIFAAGDCVEKELNQIANAIGEGATAAYYASKYINEKI